MADVKWIKVYTDMFDSSRKIKHIERMEQGDTIIVIWFKLLLLAGKINDGGAIYITQSVPYDIEGLADELRREPGIVEHALSVFEMFDMIERSGGFIYISSWEEYQNIEGLDKIREQNRKRVAKHRENKKKKLIGVTEKCVYCGETGDTVDHVIPKAKGGLDIPQNTVRCCLHCNMQKNDHDVAKFLNDRLLLKEPVDIEGIIANSVLQQYICFDYAEQRFVTLHVTQGNGTEEEKEEEQEQEPSKKKNGKKKKPATKPAKETAHTLFDRLCSDYDFSENLIAKIREWLTYKIERKEDYTEQGMKSLLRRLENKYKEYNKKDKALCELIDECMANGWKGIIFDRLPPPDNSSFDVDDFFQAACQRSFGEKKAPNEPRAALEREVIDRASEKAQNPPKTAADDDTIRERMEALKAKLG